MFILTLWILALTVPAVIVDQRAARPLEASDGTFTLRKASLLNDKQELLQHYMDVQGLITVDRDPTPESTKNGLEHTGFALTLFSALGILDTADRLRFAKTVLACEKEPGLYNRLPGCPDEASQDDARGVCAGSAVSNFSFHRETLFYGLRHFFVYNNVSPGQFIVGWNPLNWKWFAFRLRFLDDVSWYFALNFRLAKYNCILPTYILGRLWFGPVNYYRILDYMMLETLARDSWVWRRILNYWLPRSHLLEATEGYYNQSGKPEHPMVRLVSQRLRKI